MWERKLLRELKPRWQITQRMRLAETEEGEQEDVPSEEWLSSGGGKNRTKLNSKPVDILKLEDRC